MVWVGGMFFALLALRPATAPLEPGPRLDLWSRVLARFFAWVFAAIVLLLASGYGLDFRGIRRVRRGGTAHPYHAGDRHRDDAAVPAPLFRAVAALPGGRGAPRLPEAARQLNQIRWIVTVNLVLGL